MRTLIYFLLFMTGYSVQSQTSNKIVFEYDLAGNQVLRELVCVNCDTPTASRPMATLDLPEETLRNKLTYYPNPVLEQLNIEWQIIDDIFITDIEVYSITGQLVSSKHSLDSESSTVIGFQNLDPGIYHVILINKEGGKEVIKVIKK